MGVVGFAGLCGEMLDGTLSSTDSATSLGSASAAQKQKVRRETLRALKAVLRVRPKDGSSVVASSDVAKTIAASARKVRDALPARHGEVYQLCLHVVRALQPPKPGSSGDEAAGGKRAKRAVNGDTASGKRRKVDAPAMGATKPQIAKGSKSARR